MYVIDSKVGGTEPSKPFDIGLRAPGFGAFALLGFDVILAKYFLTLAPFLPSEWQCIFCVILCMMYIIGLLI